MTTLHTVNKSPFSHSTLSSCIAVCRSGDGLLLIEDGVYGALVSTPIAEQLAQLVDEGIKIFALDPDIAARGLADKLLPVVQVTDYDGFVRLSSEHRCIQSWY